MPSVSDRSLVRMGDGGLVMTIPKSWAKYYQLKAGYAFKKMPELFQQAG